MGSSSIAIIGTGAIAQALGRLLHERGEQVVAVAGRSESRSRHAAAFIGAGVTATSVEAIPGLATRVIIATSDDRIASVAEALAAAGFVNGLALHTCGGRAPSVLRELQRGGVGAGVLHPLQTVFSPEQGMTALLRIPFGVAGDAEAVAWAHHIVSLLEGRAVPIDPEQMAIYHAAAVLASSGIVAAIDSAALLMDVAGVGTSALLAIESLCRTTVNNVFVAGPQAALTGPIVRGDVATVIAHVRALDAAPKAVADLYRASGTTLLDLAQRRGLPEDTRQALFAALSTPPA